MSKSNWVSMPEAADKTGGEITVGYTGMPSGFDVEQLQINADALRRGVIGWGGYSALTLASYAGDADQYSFGAGSTDSNGVATATGSAVISKAESSSHQPASDQELNSFDIRNGVLGVQWNINALNSRIETHQQFDPKVRALQLSHEIRTSTIKGVAEHNITGRLKDNPMFINVFAIAVDGWFVQILADELLRTDYSGTVTTLAVRAMLLGGLFRATRTTSMGYSFKDGIADPLSWAARPTRTAIAAGVLSSNRLVRKTPRLVR